MLLSYDINTIYMFTFTIYLNIFINKRKTQYLSLVKNMRFNLSKYNRNKNNNKLNYYSLYFYLIVI